MKKYCNHNQIYILKSFLHKESKLKKLQNKMNKVTLHNIIRLETIGSYLEYSNLMFIDIGDLPLSHTISIEHNPLRKIPMVVFSILL